MANMLRISSISFIPTEKIAAAADKLSIQPHWVTPDAGLGLKEKRFFAASVARSKDLFVQVLSRWILDCALLCYVNRAHVGQNQNLLKRRDTLSITESMTLYNNKNTTVCFQYK